MKLKEKALLIIGFVILNFSVNAQELKNEKDSLSYAIGVDIANSFKRQNVDLNLDVFTKALASGLENKATMTPEQCSSYIREYFMNLSTKAGKENKAKGLAFLEKNKTEAGVVTLPSGLQYKVLKEGTGVKPTVNDRVTVHYAGTTLDGEEFDSSIKRGEPATFGVTQVIKGWTEALQLMAPGAKWKLFIPDNLAYGAQGPPAIGPNQVLIFDVELIEIAK